MKTSKLWLKNTSRHDDRACFILCRTARESVERGLTQGQTLCPVIVKLTGTSKGWAGRAYWNELVNGEWWRRVLVRIGSEERLARDLQVRDHRFKGDMPEYTINGWREALVMVAAHEMEHAVGAAGTYAGEFRCEMAALDAVEYYRANRSRIDGEIDRHEQRAKSVQAVRELRQKVSKLPTTIAAKKLQAARTKLARWQRRLKLATTKAKHYQRAVNRMERRLAETTPEQLAGEFELAAKGQP
jgi:hypothetical protein